MEVNEFSYVKSISISVEKGDFDMGQFLGTNRGGSTSLCDVTERKS